MATVHLDNITYKGHEIDGVNMFHGIPYAAPFKRFQPPEPPKLDGEVLDVSRWGAVSPQLPSRLAVVMGPTPTDSGKQDEETCGVLSVYTPKNAQQRQGLPVMVFVHGGAFVTGSSQMSIYHGRNLARDGNIIVVSISYRLGILGYHHAETDNQPSLGTLDVAAAFKWVRQNIAHFGGDGRNITGFGQSAGAWYIHALLDVFPDLLDQAILHSCPGGTETGRERQEAVRKTMIDSLPGETTLETASTEQLLDAQLETSKKLQGIIPPFWPSITESMYKRSERPKKIMICWTKDDGSVFAHLAGKDVEEHGSYFTRSTFSGPSTEHGQRWRVQGHEVSFYEFTWLPKDFVFGAAHCIDLPLLFGDGNAWKDSPMLGKTPWEDWNAAGSKLRKWWGLFAANGSRPQGDDELLVPLAL